LGSERSGAAYYATWRRNATVALIRDSPGPFIVDDLDEVDAARRRPRPK
jgi:hypothetical protein